MLKVLSGNKAAAYGAKLARIEVAAVLSYYAAVSDR